MNQLDLNDAHIVMETERLRCWAGKNVAPEMIDDFVQESAIKWFEGRSITTPYRHLLADYLRKVGFTARKGKIPTDALRSAVYGVALDNLPAPQRGKVDPRIGQLIKQLTTTKRIVVVLRFCWGLSSREISFVLGVDEARVSQIFREIRLKK